MKPWMWVVGAVLLCCCGGVGGVAFLGYQGMNAVIKPATDFADAKVTPWLATMDEAGMKPMVTASPLFSPADVKAMKEKHGGLKTGSKVAWAFAGVDSKTNNGDTTIDMRLNGAAEFEKGPATVSLTLESKGQPGDWKVKDLSIN